MHISSAMGSTAKSVTTFMWDQNNAKKRLQHQRLKPKKEIVSQMEDTKGELEWATDGGAPLNLRPPAIAEELGMQTYCA